MKFNSEAFAGSCPGLEVGLEGEVEVEEPELELLLPEGLLRSTIGFASISRGRG